MSRSCGSCSEKEGRAVTSSGEIILGSDGVYRWAYDLNLFTNPTILILLFKIMGGSMLGVLTVITLISTVTSGFRLNGPLRDLKASGLIMLVILGLTFISYFIYAVMMGGRYCVLFEMDEKGVKHIQAPKQFKKAQAMAYILSMSSKNIGRKGQAVMIASKSASVSEWKSVKSISFHPFTHVIKVKQTLNYNQVYVKTEDFEFVRNFIVSHCPDAKIRGR